VTLDNRDDEPGVRIPPPLLYIAVLVLGILLDVAYPVHFLPATVAWTFGALILVAGIALGPFGGSGRCIAPIRRFGRTDPPRRS
jgi:hypothetical protein